MRSARARLSAHTRPRENGGHGSRGCLRVSPSCSSRAPSLGLEPAGGPGAVANDCGWKGGDKGNSCASVSRIRTCCCCCARAIRAAAAGARHGATAIRGDDRDGRALLFLAVGSLNVPLASSFLNEGRGVCLCFRRRFQRASRGLGHEEIEREGAVLQDGARVWRVVCVRGPAAVSPEEEGAVGFERRAPSAPSRPPRRRRRGTNSNGGRPRRTPRLSFHTHTHIT